MSIANIADLVPAKYASARTDAAEFEQILAKDDEDSTDLTNLIDRLEGLARRLDIHGWRQEAPRLGKNGKPMAPAEVASLPKKYAAWRHTYKHPLAGVALVPHEHSLFAQRVHDLSGSLAELRAALQATEPDLLEAQAEFDAWLACADWPPPAVPVRGKVIALRNCGGKSKRKR